MIGVLLPGGLMYLVVSFTRSQGHFIRPGLSLVEAYQLCDRGEVADLLADDAFRADGARPVNTHGGDFAAGYSAGFRHVLEATRQLRAEADNQVPDAEFAVVGAPQLGPTSGAILQRSER